MLRTKRQRWGQKGGRKRKRNLSPERRREIAQKAAQARWNREPQAAVGQ